METLNDVQVARALLSANWDRSVLPTAISVVLGEHRGTVKPSVVSRPNSDGSRDYGLMSINNKAHPEKLKTGNWQNPVDNARMGLAVYKERGNSFSPWTVYPAISSMYMPRGIAAAKAVQGEAAGTPTNIPIVTPVASDTGTGLFDLHQWKRTGLVAAGVILLLVVGFKMTNAGSALKMVKNPVVSMVSKGSK